MRSHPPQRRSFAYVTHSRLNAMQLPHRAPFREAMAVINRYGPPPTVVRVRIILSTKQQDSDNGRVNRCFTGAAQVNTRKRWEASNRIQHWCGDFFHSFMNTCLCLWLIVIESRESVHGPKGQGNCVSSLSSVHRSRVRGLRLTAPSPLLCNQAFHA